MPYKRKQRMNLTSFGSRVKPPVGRRLSKITGPLKAFGVQRVRSPFRSRYEIRIYTACIGQRQYAKQTVYDAHLSSKKHQKAAARLEADGATTKSAVKLSNGANSHADETNASNPSTSKNRQPARLTHLITSLLVPLLPTIGETKANVERRFSLTAREREEELVEDAPVAAPPTADGVAQEEEPEEEERIYNPLKLPLGWDGKPIPYWLYKLHGLGVEYRCEICSDYVYMGRKNFERHFQVCSTYEMRKIPKISFLLHRKRDMLSECVLWGCQIQNTSTKSLKFRMHLLVSDLSLS